MRLIIAGSRGLGCYEVEEAIETFLDSDPDVVISGGARGVDLAGEQWAQERGIPIERHLAKWDLHGKAAGYRRNWDMAEFATHLLAIWDGESKGTKHMIDIMFSQGKQVWVHIPHRLRKPSEKGGGL